MSQADDGRNQEEQYSDAEEQSSSEMPSESPVDLAESRLQHGTGHIPHRTAPCPAGCEIGPWKIQGADRGEPRAAQSFNYRFEAAQDEYNRSFAASSVPVVHDCNGDEVLYQGQKFIGSFTKGLPHDINGEVDPVEYCKLLTALDTSEQTDFNNINLGCGSASRKLEDPQGSYCFDLEGADSHSLRIPPAPAFASQEEIADILENYWMALARDIPVEDFPPASANPLFAAAFTDLNQFPFYSAGGGEFFPVPLTSNNVFRGFTPGD
jgi:hypothetical protein